LSSLILILKGCDHGSFLRHVGIHEIEDGALVGKEQRTSDGENGGDGGRRNGWLNHCRQTRIPDLGALGSGQRRQTSMMARALVGCQIGVRTMVVGGCLHLDLQVDG
jgi:hypothetical protein